MEELEPASDSGAAVDADELDGESSPDSLEATQDVPAEAAVLALGQILDALALVERDLCCLEGKIQQKLNQLMRDTECACRLANLQECGSWFHCKWPLPRLPTVAEFVDGLFPMPTLLI